jgi:hypothetical protein
MLTLISKSMSNLTFGAANNSIIKIKVVAEFEFLK